MAIDEIRDMTNQVRRMGWVPPTAEGLKMRASRTNIQTLRTNAGLSPLLSRSEWVEKDFIKPFGKKLIGDQKQTGGCTGWSGAGASLRQRLMRGETFKERLSGANLYDQINGGHDNGSNIIDSRIALENNGVCFESEQLAPTYRKPSGALLQSMAKNRETLAITVTNFDECMTAIQMGLFPQFPIYVGNRFEKFSGDGVAGLDKARQGNHSVYGAAAVYINGVWYIGMPNSWWYTWGPFASGSLQALRPGWEGCCLLTEAHINECAYADDGYAHAATLPAQQAA